MDKPCAGHIIAFKNIQSGKKLGLKVIRKCPKCGWFVGELYGNQKKS